MASRRGTRKQTPAPGRIGGGPLTPLLELGTTGLKTTGGRVWEELLPQLQGPRAIAIYREMALNDPTVGAMLRAIEMLIRRVEWNTKPASDDAMDVARAEFVQQCIDDMSETWADTLAGFLSFIRYGFSVHEEVYKRREGPSSDPKLSSKYNDGRIGWARLPARAQDTIDQWIWDENGTLLGCVQKAPPDFRDRLLPWNRFLLFRAGGEKSNPEGQSVLRTAYRPWFFKKRIEEIEGIGVERDLAGLPTALVPPELLAADAPENLKQQLRQIEVLLRNIRRDQREGVIFPQSFDENGKPLYELKLLSTGGRRQFDTSDIVGRYDTRIAMSVLADFVLMGHEKVGSFALASSKTDLFAVALGAWLDVVTEQMNRFAIPRLLRLNAFPFGEKLPTLEHGDIETVDLAEISAYVTQLVGAGVIVPSPGLEKHLLQNAGLPEPEEGEGLEAKAARDDAMAAQIAGQPPAGEEPDPEDPDGENPPPGAPGGPPRPPPGQVPPQFRKGGGLVPRPFGAAAELGKAYDPDQPRDDDGRFSSDGGGGSASPEEIGRLGRAITRRMREGQREMSAALQAGTYDEARGARVGREIRELRRQLAVAEGADPEVTVGTPFRLATGQVDWVVTAIRPQTERVLGGFVVSARSADGKKTRETVWENEIRVRPRVGKLWDPDQPRDEAGRWGDGSEGGNATALRAGRAPVQGADSSALELPGWSADRSLTSANGQQVDERTGKPIPGPDTMFGEIARAQGYDGAPRVVSAEVMDRLVAQNKLELFRGLGGPEAAQHADDLRGGELFAGRGALGSGIYTASATEAVPDPHAKASEYATRTGGRGAVVRMTLHPDARIADHDEMRRDMVRDRAAAERRGASAAHLAAQYQDVGRYAALRGYDVVRHEGTGYHVVLNRTALIVQRENVMAKAAPDACLTSCPAALSQQIGPWFATRTVAALTADRARALTRDVLRVRRWTDLSLENRALLLRAQAEFEGAAVPQRTAHRAPPVA